MKRKMGFLLAAVLLTALLAMPVCAARAVSRPDAVAWLRAQDNAYYDLDGAYGAQCSDFTTAYMNWCVTGDPYSGTYGVWNACDYPDVAREDPANWIVIPNQEGLVPEPGDIFVSVGNYPTLGHTGVILEARSADRVSLIDQNTRWDGAQNATLYEEMWMAGSYEVTYYIRYRHLTADGHTHTYSASVLRPATCSEPGERKMTCTCGDSYTEEIPLAAHSFAEVERIEPTCEKEGQLRLRCSVCGAESEETIPAAGHQEKRLPGRAPTATEPGLGDGKVCAACGAVLQKQEEIPALGAKDPEPGEPQVAADSPGRGPLLWILLSAGVLLLAGAGLAIFLILRKKKSSSR